MFIPIGDYPNPRGTPWMTLALIALNCLVFVFVTMPLSGVRPDLGDPILGEYLRMLAPHLPPGTSLREVVMHTSAYDLYVFEHGYRPAAPGLFALFSAMFLHGGFMHLAGNMLYLWIYGDNVEHRLGALPFLFWYLATGVAATLFHALFNLRSPIPLVGASGAISGVLGFYLMWFHHHYVRVWVFLFPFYVGIVSIGAAWVLGAYLLIDNLLPFMTRGSEGGVAHGAHIGGFIAGVAVAWLMKRRAAR